MRASRAYPSVKDRLLNWAKRLFKLLLFGLLSAGGGELRTLAASQAQVAVRGVGSLTSYGVSPTGPPDLPSLSISDVSGWETDEAWATLLFDITLSKPSTETVTVSFQARAATATFPSDFLFRAEVVSFPPGVTNRSIALNVRGDRAVEADETFFVDLLSPSGATLAKARGVGTILDDDGRPQHLYQFTWDPISNVQILGEPFPVTLRALDSSGAPATEFGGPAMVRAEMIRPDFELGSGTWYFEEPLQRPYRNVRTQFIYYPEELGGARIITGLGLWITNPPTYPLERWTIRLKPTSLRRFQDSSKWETNGWRVAYQSREWQWPAGWKVWEFESPFPYDGTNGLMVDLSLRNISRDGQLNAPAIKSTFTKEFRALWASDDLAEGDSMNWAGRAALPLAIPLLADLRLVSHASVACSPTQAVTFANGVWTGWVAIGESAAPVALRATDTNLHTGFSHPFEVRTAAGNPADTDHDGMPDFWELANGLNPYFGADALLDADGDGMTNQAEYVAGTNPFSNQSAFRISPVLSADDLGTYLRLGFNTVPGLGYQLERTLSLGDSAWEHVAEGYLHSSGTEGFFNIRNLTNSSLYQLFRVRIVPQPR